MQISKKSQKKSPLKIALAVLIVVILAGAGAYAYYSTRDNTSGNNSQTDADAATDDQTDDSVSGPTKDSATGKGENQFESEPTDTAENATMTITTLKQANNMVSVRTTAQNVDKGGRCIVYFTSDAGTPISKYMTVTDSSSGVNCSIDINELEFTYLGNWSARVVYTTPDNKKVEALGTLTIK